jgi:DNA-binding Lrp family transcriptional regulator
MLFTNSRIPIRDLSDKLNISIQATHRRIQILKDEGLINRFKASLSIGYLHAIRVLVEGISQGNPDDVVKRLRNNDMVHSVFIGEGQPHLFLECIIRDIKDMDSLVEYMRKKIEIPNPNILLDSQVKFGENVLNTRYKGPAELSPLDYQIIHALYEDARLPIGDIAEKCDASTRTVKRHLDRLMENGAIDFSIDWRPGNASGLTSMLAVILKESADQKKVRDELYEKFSGSLFVITTLSNVTGLISSYAWSSSIKKYNELLVAIKDCDGILDVQSSLLKDGWMQDTWRDKLLKEKI